MDTAIRSTVNKYREWTCELPGLKTETDDIHPENKFYKLLWIKEVILLDLWSQYDTL